MLVIANGAPKGGSTWIYYLARELPGFAPVPDDLRDPAFSNASVHIDKVEELLARGGDHYSKNHWSGEDRHRRLLERDDVRMLNVVRDLRDVVVSFYHHMVRGGLTEAAFPEWFETSGLRHARRYIAYQTFWHSAPPEPLLVSYDSLRERPRETMAAIARHAGVEPTDALLDAMARTDARHPDSRIEPHKIGPGRFFRRAISGDWREHMDAAMAARLEALERETGYDEVLAGMRRRFPL